MTDAPPSPERSPRARRLANRGTPTPTPAPAPPTAPVASPPVPAPQPAPAPGPSEPEEAPEIEVEEAPEIEVEEAPEIEVEAAPEIEMVEPEPTEEPAGPAPLPRLGLTEALLMDRGDPLSELDKIIKMVLDAANIGHLTELTQNEINAFSKARALCRRHPVSMKAGMELMAENLILRVSKSRKGRGELFKVLSRFTGLEEARLQQMQGAPPRGGFFGRRR